MADKDKDEDLFKRFALLQSSSSGTKPSTTPALSEGLDELWFRLHKLKVQRPLPYTDSQVTAFHYLHTTQKPEHEQCEDLLAQIQDDLRLDEITGGTQTLIQPSALIPKASALSPDEELESRFRALRAGGDPKDPDTVCARLDRAQDLPSHPTAAGISAGRINHADFLQSKRVDEETQIQQLIQQTIEETNLKKGQKRAHSHKTDRTTEKMAKKTKSPERKKRRYSASSDSFSLSDSSSYSDSGSDSYSDSDSDSDCY